VVQGADVHLSAGWLTTQAEGILRDCSVLEFGDLFEARVDRNELFEAMSEAQEQASTGHVDRKTARRSKTWSPYVLAACAAYQLVYAHRSIFKNEVPEFRPAMSGIAVPYQADVITIQDCALRLAEKVLSQTGNVNLLPDGFNSDYAEAQVRRFLDLLNLVPFQDQTTIKTTAPKLVDCLQQLAGKTTWRHRAEVAVRRQVRLRPLSGVMLALLVGLLVATVIAYIAWPDPPAVPASGSVEAMTTAPVLANVTEQVSAVVIDDAVDDDEQHQLDLDPWSAPPTVPVVLKLNDPLNNVLEIQVRLRLQDSDGSNPRVNLGVQWAPGTGPVTAQTTVTNAIQTSPTGGRVPDLVAPAQVLPLKLDKDPGRTETVVTMMATTNPKNVPNAGATMVPTTFRCGYNPAPISILLSPGDETDVGNDGSTDRVLVTVVPLYVLKSC
jgi:hypothetical protein